MVLLGGFFSTALIAPLHSVEIRVDACVYLFVLCTVQRGFAYGFSFNTHLASRERKTRSRSRKVIFPLASLDRREPAGIAVSIGRLFNRKPGFSAVYLSVPCTQPYLVEGTKEKGAKLYRARETAYLASSAPGNSLRSQIKCHSPRRQDTRRIAR